MPSLASVTGPGHMFVGLGPNKTPVYLGTAQITPRIEIRPSYSPYYNSVFSPSVPMDWLYQGEQGYLYADLNRKVDAVYEQMLARPTYTSPARRFANIEGDLGAMQIQEGKTYPFWIQFPYANKITMSHLRKGLRFYNAIPIGPDSYDNINVQDMVNRLILQFTPSLSVGVFNMTKAVLCDSDMTGLPVVT